MGSQICTLEKILKENNIAVISRRVSTTPTTQTVTADSFYIKIP